MTSVGCELASVEEAAARVASAFARKQSIHAACEATTRFRWEGVDDDVDAAMKTLGGDDDRVVVFHAGSKFEPSAMVKAAEMMTRDDDAVTLGKGWEKGNHHHAADESGSAHEGKKEQELPLPGDGDEPSRPMTNRTTPPAPAAPPHPIHEIHRGESAPGSSKKSSKKDSNAGLGEGSETSNGGLFKMFSGWMRRRESAEERDFRAWLKKHQAGEVRPATAARRLLLSAEDEAESHHSHGSSDGGWACVIVGENAHVAEKISRAARTEGLPCASVVNRVRGGLALKGEKTDECFAKRARAIDVKLMSRARHTVATEPSDGAHVAALLRRCAREAA